MLDRIMRIAARTVLRALGSGAKVFAENKRSPELTMTIEAVPGYRAAPKYLAPIPRHGKTNPGHFYLLSAFNKPRPISEFGEREHWRNRLGESPEAAGHRLMELGHLAQASDAETIAATVSRPQLQAWCKAREISASGNKTVLAQRLLQHAPDLARPALLAKKVYRRTDQGVAAVREFFNAERQCYAATLVQLFRLIEQGEYPQAMQEAARYGETRVFGVGAWIEKIGDFSIAESTLRSICSPDLARRYNLSPPDAERAKIEAVAEFLLGAPPKNIYDQE